MSRRAGFSQPLELPNIPDGAGVGIIEDDQGNVLAVVMSNNIRRRIGELLDSRGTLCVHGPKIHAAQEAGQRIFIRWKLTEDYKEEKKLLVEQMEPSWG